MNGLKYVFIDVDGTLINDNKEITIPTQNELKRVISEYDAKIFFVSSRAPKSLDGLWNKIGLTGGIVGFNGTIIKWKGDYIDQSNANFSLLSKELIQALINKISRDNVSFNIYTADNWYVNNINYWTEREIQSTGITPDSGRLETILANKDPKIHKILIRSDEIEMSQILKILFNFNIHNLARLNLVKPTLVELTPLGIDKGLAMKTILREFKAVQNNTIAFGDGENDLEMIQFAKIGVVMDNAVPKLKEIADYITLSNNEDGVAIALKKYFPERT